MGLNIKNERVCRLAREAAERTGQTQAGAIESALEHYLAGLLAAASPANTDQVATTFARLDAVMAAADREAIRTGLEDLYDEATGLPA